jgi:hypothetical protein
MGSKVLGMSGEATWRTCNLTNIPYINHKNTSSLEPEPYPTPFDPLFSSRPYFREKKPTVLYWTKTTNVSDPQVNPNLGGIDNE